MLSAAAHLDGVLEEAGHSVVVLAAHHGGDARRRLLRRLVTQTKARAHSRCISKAGICCIWACLHPSLSSAAAAASCSRGPMTEGPGLQELCCATTKLKGQRWVRLWCGTGGRKQGARGAWRGRRRGCCRAAPAPSCAAAGVPPPPAGTPPLTPPAGPPVCIPSRASRLVWPDNESNR